MSDDHSPVVNCSFDGHPIDDPLNIHVESGKIYCDFHFGDLFLPKCHGCQQPIRGEFIKISDNSQWHKGNPHCWKCTDCHTELQEDTASTLHFGVSVYCCRPCGVKRSAANSDGTKDEKAVEALGRLEELKRLKDREAKENADAMGKVIPPESSPSYQLAQLKKSATKKIPIDVSKRELYLSDADFMTHFKMDKGAFGKLPKWKQDGVKKTLDLF